jgi:hypothetical protein
MLVVKRKDRSKRMVETKEYASCQEKGYSKENGRDQGEGYSSRERIEQREW